MQSIYLNDTEKCSVQIFTGRKALNVITTILYPIQDNFYSSSISCHPAYLLAYFKTLGQVQIANLFLVFHGSNIVGYFCTEEVDKCEHIVVSRLSDYADLAVRKGAKHLVAEVLSAYIIREKLSIEFPKASIWDSNAYHLASNYNCLEVFFGKQNFYSIVSSSPSFDSYISTKTKRRRENINRNIRKLEKNFIVEIIKQSDFGIATRLFFKWHQKRHRDSKYSNPKRRQFFIEKLNGLSFNKKMFGIQVKKKKDCLLVGIFWYFEHNGELQYFNGAWDPQYHKDSIGTKIHSFLIKEALNTQRSYNFLFGHEDYKMKFANALNSTRKIVIRSQIDIPQKQFIPSKDKRVCVLIAHPDDEVIFFGGLLESLQKKRIDFDVISLTWFFGDSMYTSTRRREFLLSSKYYGFTPINLGLEDLPGYHLDLDQTIERFRKLTVNYKTIYTHGPLGEYGHPHHIEASFISASIFTGKTYFLYPQETFNCMKSPVSFNSVNKDCILRELYPSQANLERLFPKFECYFNLDNNILLNIFHKLMKNRKLINKCSHKYRYKKYLKYVDVEVDEIIKSYNNEIVPHFPAKVLSRFWIPLMDKVGFFSN